MRARNIKPSFFENEDLAELEPAVRLLFIGLWCIADREGKLEDRPKRIHGQIFRWDTKLDINGMLGQLAAKDLIVRYTFEGSGYIRIPKFSKHQNPHPREQKSLIPDVNGSKPIIPEKLPAPSSRPAALAPPAKKTKEKPIDFWKELVDHMDRTWLAKRKSKFYWKAQHFKNLKTLAGLYQPWGVMALWDAFLAMNDDWVRSTGYSFEAFAAKIPKLVDDSFWKMGAKSYEEELNGPMPDIKVGLKEVGK